MEASSPFGNPFVPFDVDFPDGTKLEVRTDPREMSQSELFARRDIALDLIETEYGALRFNELNVVIGVYSNALGVFVEACAMVREFREKVDALLAKTTSAVRHTIAAEVEKLTAEPIGSLRDHVRSIQRLADLVATLKTAEFSPAVSEKPDHG